MDLTIDFYKNNVFSSDKLEFRLICVCLASLHLLQVRRQSKWKPRYLTLSLCGILTPFNEMGVQVYSKKTPGIWSIVRVLMRAVIREYM